MLRPRSVSVSVLAIRDLRTSCLRTDPSTSGATPKLVTGGWSGFFAKSKFTSGPTIRDSITMSWPSLMSPLPAISPGPRRNVVSPAIGFNVDPRQMGVRSSPSASSSIAVIDLSGRIAGWLDGEKLANVRGLRGLKSVVSKRRYFVVDAMRDFVVDALRASDSPYFWKWRPGRHTPSASHSVLHWLLGRSLI